MAVILYFQIVDKNAKDKIASFSLAGKHIWILSKKIPLNKNVGKLEFYNFGQSKQSTKLLPSPYLCDIQQSHRWAAWDTLYFYAKPFFLIVLRDKSLGIHQYVLLDWYNSSR